MNEQYALEEVLDVTFASRSYLKNDSSLIALGFSLTINTN